MVNIVRKNCVIFVREGETTNECYSWFWIFHARSKWRRAKARRIKMEKLFECDDAPPSYESLESIQSSFPKNNISIKESRCRSFLKLIRYEDFLFSLTPTPNAFFLIHLQRCKNVVYQDRSTTCPPHCCYVKKWTSPDNLQQLSSLAPCIYYCSL